MKVGTDITDLMVHNGQHEWVGGLGKKFWQVWMPKIFKVDLFWPGKILCIFLIPTQRSED